MRAFIFAVAALVALAPVANATPEDDQYLAILKARNFGGDPDKLIGYAHDACDNYGTPELFVAQVDHMQAIGYTETQTKIIIAWGCRPTVRTNCPRSLPQEPRPQLLFQLRFQTQARPRQP